MRYWIGLSLALLVSGQTFAAALEFEVPVTVTGVSLDWRSTILLGTDRNGAPVRIDCGQGPRVLQSKTIQFGVPTVFVAQMDSQGVTTILCK